MDVSVSLPLMPSRPEWAVQFGALAQRTSTRRLWCGQGMTLAQHQVHAYLAGMGLRLSAGVGVSLMPFQHPLDAALHARSLAAITGEPMIAGFGPGAPALQKAVRGSAYEKPLRATREYLQILRPLLDGQSHAQEGDYFSFNGGMYQIRSPRVDLGVGVLRPGMARLAGEVADVAICWLTPASYVEDVLVPALEKGAERAGRPVPRLVVMVPLAVDRPGRDPVALARTPHVNFPHYQDMLRRAGVTVDEDDADVTLRSMIENEVFLFGSPAAIAKQIDEYREVGVDEVVLNTTGVALRENGRAAVTEFEEILREVRS